MILFRAFVVVFAQVIPSVIVFYIDENWACYLFALIGHLLSILYSHLLFLLVTSYIGIIQAHIQLTSGKTYDFCVLFYVFSKSLLYKSLRKTRPRSRDVKSYAATVYVKCTDVTPLRRGRLPLHKRKSPHTGRPMRPCVQANRAYPP